MNSTNSSDITFVFVTHNLPHGLHANLDKTTATFRSQRIIVVDNSTELFREENRKICCLYENVEYVGSTLNNRFHAYNTAIAKISSGYIAFRSDDDDFDEKLYKKVFSNKEVKDEIMVLRYMYDGKTELNLTLLRPIESMIVKVDLFKNAGPMNLELGSDWEYFTKNFHTARVHFSKYIAMNKKVHGRI